MKFLSEENVSNKRVVLRCDFNVPVKDGIILDNSKIIKSLKTIKLLLNNNNKVVILSHFGRVKSEEDFNDNSLKIVFDELKKHINVVFSNKPIDIEKDLLEYECILLENTRFNDVPNKRESINDLELAKYYASLGDVFVFDAFGASHRIHSSTAGIANYLPTYIGLLVEEEIYNLSVLFENINNGFVAIMGGAKVDDKIPLINYLINKCDKLVLTGGILNSFLKQKGLSVGNSLVNTDELVNESILQVLKQHSDKLVFSDKFVVEDGKIKNILEINENDKICDNIINDNLTLNNAKIIFVNGTTGMYEHGYDLGTKALFDLLPKMTAKTIIGGGDTSSAVKKYANPDDFYYVSSGGGATLEYIVEGKIKVLDYIENKQK